MTRSLDIQQIINDHLSPKEAEQIKTILDYNYSGGKRTRSFIYEEATRFIGKEPLPVISASLEILHESFIIIDDVMDNSEKRRGKETWFKKMGLNALKDGFLVVSVLNLLLQKAIKDRSMYVKILNFYSEVIFWTCLGQTEDSIKMDYKNWKDVESNFCTANYESICAGKTGYYTFYLPIKMAFICSGVKESKNLRRISELLGLLFQMQDDYLYFIPEVCGKIGTDFEERKLSWFTLKIVEEGECPEVMDYFKGGDLSIMYKKAEKYLKTFDDDVNALIKRIRELKEDETDEIVEWCIKLLYKRKN